jgi:chemotaxis protein CheX
MNVQYTNAILDGIKQTFIQMLDLDIKFNNPIVKSDLRPSYKISSVVTISGNLTGCFVLSFPKEVARCIASTILGYTTTSKAEVMDAIQEIANMVSGQADTELELDGVCYSLPVMSTETDKVLFPKDSIAFSMDCMIGQHAFEIIVALEKEISACSEDSIC